MVKKTVGSSSTSRPTTLKAGRTLSETTYKAGLSAMKQAIRKDDRASSGKHVERGK